MNFFRQREYGCGSEAGIPQELAESEAEIVHSFVSCQSSVASCW
jgi:hypothetical protein